MSLAFKREYKLFIRFANGKEITIDNEQGTSRESWYLRVKFQTSLTMLDSVGMGLIEIYNLKKETRDSLNIPYFDISTSKAKETGFNLATVELSAGYYGSMSKIYRGSVVYGLSEYNKPEWVTKLNVIPSLDISQKQKQINDTHKRGAKQPETSILKLLISNLSGQGNTIASDAVKIATNLGGAVESDQKKATQNSTNTQRDVPLFGQPFKLLRERIKKTGKGACWHDPIDDTVKLCEFGVPNVGSYELSSDTGLTGVPDVSPYNVNCQSLINPGIKVGTGITLKSKTYNGVLQVLSIEAVGDTHGAEWLYKINSLRVDSAGLL